MTRVVNLRKEKYDVYIGRGSKWGNPFTHREGTSAKYIVPSRDEAVDKYEEWLLSNPNLMASLEELKGKVLGCFCKPARCHGDVLVKLIENMKES